MRREIGFIVEIEEMFDTATHPPFRCEPWSDAVTVPRMAR
jgi:hypothetical protein